MLVFTFYGCKKNDNINNSVYDDKNYIAKSFIFPDSIKILDEDLVFRDMKYDNFIDYYKDQPLIIIIISGDCHACISKIKKWDKIISNNIFGEIIDFIFIITTKDKDYFVRNFYEQLEYSSEFVIDTKDKFFKLNVFNDIPESNVFLLDKDHNFIMRGDPVLFSEHIELFKKEISYIE